ncbi:hypothetical protein BDN72DRAFT_74504 [Pluteus cervinus]|uniref:Uncharacterized protein n=1 Tax=Pluteus cervinus TaxID=181527 RepID=A0ACD3AQK6_9AGAR|nr:hypothetical protein BDN72DRAFT_74504 [Pluteus cervinus]
METLKDQQAQIDAEILTLEARIITLRVVRNEHAPINQLPDDVLIEIFTMVIKSDGKPKGILPMAKVARRWRAISLNHSGFWSKINNSNLCQADIWLARSKSSALTVCVSDLYYEDLQSFRLVLHHSNRIAHLVFLPSRHYSRTDWSWFPQMWQAQPFPSLRKLIIRDLDIPDSLSIPRLEHLVLEDCSFNFVNLLPTFSNLTSLTLLGASLSNRIPIRTFTECLGHMKELKVLTTSLEWLVEQPGFIRPNTTASILFNFNPPRNSWERPRPFDSQVISKLHRRISARGAREIQEISLERIRENERRSLQRVISPPTTVGLFPGQHLPF